jgi:flap endonuclease-1
MPVLVNIDTRSARMNDKFRCLGDEEAFDKFARRTVKVTREHVDDCKRLLKYMGVPYVDAPTEAEARKSHTSFVFSFISL